MARRSFTYDGRRYFVRGKDDREVFEKMALKKHELETARARTETVLVRDWIDRAIAVYKPNISDAYRYEMTHRLHKHVVPAIGHLPIRAVQPIQLQQILNTQRGMSRSHIIKLQQELRFVFRTARQNNLISEDPTEYLQRPSGYVHKRRSITADEREHLLRVCAADPAFFLFELMLYAGCRPGEAISVIGSDLGFIQDTPVLHIRGTKTENSDRYVPVVPELLPRLQALAPDQLASPNAAGRMHTESSYKRLVSRLRRELNISMGCKVYRNQLVPPLPLADDFVPYLLRHTFCTDLQKRGVDVRAAQRLMGHADIQTTANIYTHQDDDTLLAAAALMRAGSVPNGTP